MKDKGSTIVLKGLGWTFTHISRSSAVTPLIIFYLVMGLLSWGMGLIEIFKIITFALASLLSLFFVVDPDRLRSEEYNLEMRKIALGEKGKELSPIEEGKLVQPKLLSRPKGKVARRRIT